MSSPEVESFCRKLETEHGVHLTPEEVERLIEQRKENQKIIPRVRPKKHLVLVRGFEDNIRNAYVKTQGKEPKKVTLIIAQLGGDLFADIDGTTYRIDRKGDSFRALSVEASAIIEAVLEREDDGFEQAYFCYVTDTGDGAVFCDRDEFTAPTETYAHLTEQDIDDVKTALAPHQFDTI